MRGDGGGGRGRFGGGGGGVVRVVDKGGLKEARRVVADKKALERKKKGSGQTWGPQQPIGNSFNVCFVALSLRPIDREETPRLVFR